MKSVSTARTWACSAAQDVDSNSRDCSRPPREVLCGRARCRLLGLARGLHRTLLCRIGTAMLRRLAVAAFGRRGVWPSIFQPTLNIAMPCAACCSLKARAAHAFVPARSIRQLARVTCGVTSRASLHRVECEPTATHLETRATCLGPLAATHPQCTLVFTLIVHTGSRAWRAGGLRRRHDISPPPIHLPAVCCRPEAQCTLAGCAGGGSVP